MRQQPFSASSMAQNNWPLKQTSPAASIISIICCVVSIQCQNRERGDWQQNNHRQQSSTETAFDLFFIVFEKQQHGSARRGSFLQAGHHQCCAAFSLNQCRLLSAFSSQRANNNSYPIGTESD